MRRLLLAVPLLIPLCAQAQTTAANPVEPFSYGVRIGTPKNPLVAVLSSVVPSAQAGSTQAASPVELFSYGRRVGTQSNPIYVNLGNALDGYLPLTGGTVQNLTAAASFTPPSMPYASLPTDCTLGQIAYVTDGYKFWSSVDPSPSGGGTNVYQDTVASNAGSLATCSLKGGAKNWLPLVMNTGMGSW